MKNTKIDLFKIFIIIFLFGFLFVFYEYTEMNRFQFANDNHQRIIDTKRGKVYRVVHFETSNDVIDLMKIKAN